MTQEKENKLNEFAEQLKTLAEQQGKVRWVETKTFRNFVQLAVDLGKTNRSALVRDYFKDTKGLKNQCAFNKYFNETREAVSKDEQNESSCINTFSTTLQQTEQYQNTIDSLISKMMSTQQELKKQGRQVKVIFY